MRFTRRTAWRVLTIETTMAVLGDLGRSSMNPKIKFSIRALALLTLAVALVAAWYARTAALRKAEVEAITKIEQLTGHEISISDYRYANNGCIQGDEILTQQLAPKIIESLHLDAFVRVTNLQLNFVDNPQIIDELAAFQNLQSVGFTCLTRASNADTIAPFENAVEGYKLNHPEVDVLYNLYVVPNSPSPIAQIEDDEPSDAPKDRASRIDNGNHNAGPR